MTQENYQTIFEVGFRSFPWASVCQPLVLLPIGLFLMWFRKGKRLALVGMLIVSAALFFFLISILVYLPGFIKSRDAYVSGKSAVVEGVVEDFSPAPMIGPATESFSVRGISFSYNAI
ncbi:MAG: hypothetical protein WBC92_04920, partial [Terracidiphilus sp.]